MCRMNSCGRTSSMLMASVGQTTRHAAAHAFLLVDGGQRVGLDHLHRIEETAVDAQLAAVAVLGLDGGAETAGSDELAEAGADRGPVDAAVIAAVADHVADALLVFGDVHQPLLFALLEHAQRLLAGERAAGAALDGVFGGAVELHADVQRLAAGAVDDAAGAFGHGDGAGALDELADVVHGENLRVRLDAGIDRDNAHRGVWEDGFEHLDGVVPLRAHELFPQIEHLLRRVQHDRGGVVELEHVPHAVVADTVRLLGLEQQALAKERLGHGVNAGGIDTGPLRQLGNRRRRCGGE